jgi:hypothetical protein
MFSIGAKNFFLCKQKGRNLLRPELPIFESRFLTILPLSRYMPV